MSLDTYKLHRLTGKRFDRLYKDHKEKWNKMVEKAAEGVRACVPEGDAIKAGDVVAVVEHGIRISKEFETHLAKEKLINKFWAPWYAEYIVEQIYPHAEIKEANKMSRNDAREFAKKFIEEQKRILESHGDSVVRSKYKEAIAGAQKTFEMISTPSTQAKSS